MVCPDIHELPVFINFHGILHQAVHVDELHPSLLCIEHHGRDDRELPHLLLVILHNKRQRKEHTKCCY